MNESPPERWFASCNESFVFLLVSLNAILQAESAPGIPEFLSLRLLCDTGTWPESSFQQGQVFLLRLLKTTAIKSDFEQRRCHSETLKIYFVDVRGVIEEDCNWTPI